MLLTNEEKLQRYREDKTDIVFGIKWFEKHQSKLLLLLNAPIVKYWFRWTMRIRSYDCPSGTKITNIKPNSYSWGDKYIKKGKRVFLERTTDFRTHDKYSKRLYFAFKPLWYTMHALDWAMLDRVEALTKLSFGFSTLTVYPDASPETTSVDGRVSRSPVDEVWATIRAGAGNGFSDSATQEQSPSIGSNGTTDHWEVLRRNIYLFDTSALTAGATISGAVFSTRGYNKADNLGIAPTLAMVASTPASNTALANADFSQLGSTRQADTDITYSGYSTTGYNDWTMNATGLGNISKTGVSKFGVRFGFDADNTTPTWANGTNSYFGTNFADQTGNTSDPKLVVTYTASTNYPMAAAVGAFTLTGNVILLHIGRKILMAVGAFTLTGINTLLHLGRKMISSVGAFTLTGQNILFKLGKGMQIVVGEFVLTGQNILFHIAVSIKNEVGSFALTGYDALLRKGKTMVVLVGNFALTGYDVIFHNGKRIVMALGEFTLTGYDTILSVGKKMIASLGQFTLTGQTVLLKVGRKIVASVGVFVLTGKSTVLTYGRSIILVVGEFTLTGQSAIFHLGRRMVASVGSFIITFNIFTILVNGVSNLWTAVAKHAADTPENIAKHISTWVNKLKS